MSATVTDYELGDIARLNVSFTVSGVLTDPTTITAKVLKPDGTSTTYTVGSMIHVSTGVYYLDVTCTASGRWTYKYVGTGAAADVGTGEFYVNEDPTVVDPTLYVTLEDLKSTANLSDMDFADADLIRAIRAASRGIDITCKRRFFNNGADEVRFYTPISPNLVMIDDLCDFQTLITDQNFDGTFEESWEENTEFVLTPLNADTDARPWTRLELFTGWRLNKVFPSWSTRSVKLTGTFGWAAVPDEIVDATTILATKLTKRKREAPFGVVMAALDQGVAARIARNDPDVNWLLDQFMREYST